MKTINMKQFFNSVLMVCMTAFLSAQNGYHHSYGNHTGSPLVFLHGGPGISAIDFEILIAEELAAHGFFIVVYDRMGEGRSENDAAPFTFESAFQELNAILDHYGLEKAALLGHSFGGIIGSKFAERFPHRVSHLVLMGAPLSLQSTFRTILARVWNGSENKGDSSLMELVEQTSSLDTASISYSSSCFMMAMQQGLYYASNQMEEAKLQLDRMTKSKRLMEYGDFLLKTNYKTMMQPVNGFWANEAYTTLDIFASLISLKEEGVHLAALYGVEDGLFDEAHFMRIRELIEEESLVAVLDQCGHFPYLDRPTAFIELLNKWLIHGL